VKNARPIGTAGHCRRGGHRRRWRAALWPAGNDPHQGPRSSAASAGAVIGNQLAKGSPDCTHAYGYYDNNNQWHANNVAANDAAGYYDPQRATGWQGRPNGYYDNQKPLGLGQRRRRRQRLTYASNGRWVPGFGPGLLRC